MVISKEQVKDIDISGPARALRFLRLNDYLVIACASWLLNLLVAPFIDPAMRRGEGLVLILLVAPVLSFSVYTGWRHVGVIDAGVWRWHLIAFPLLFLICLTQLIIMISSGGFDDPGTLSALIMLPWLSAIAAVGMVSILLLRKMRIAPFDVPLVELLRDLGTYKGSCAVDAKNAKRINAPRGAVLGALGATVLLGLSLAPGPSDPGLASHYARISQQISLLGYFLLIRARRYFQISADSLLSIDKRNPILFLRSFDDDEKVKFGASERALLDFSLETRLSNHFTAFGPFIAIGSPKETVPQLGAARVVLSDREWQPRVMAWMSEASVVVMYSGKSQWVTWELAKLVNTDCAERLILMIPEVKGWRRAIRTNNVLGRIERVREAFRNTKWFAPLAGLQELRDVRAMLFRSDGSLIVIRSRPRNRDSYHLAALLAHHILLKETRATLVAIRGPLQGQQFAVDTEAFHIGAASDNNLAIRDDDYVSGHHALLWYERGRLSIADQHSKNGTFVNGDRLDGVPMVVSVGDQICMGHSTFEVTHVEDGLRAARGARVTGRYHQDNTKAAA